MELERYPRAGADPPELFDTASVSLGGPELGDVLEDLKRLRQEMRDEYRRDRFA